MTRAEELTNRVASTTLVFFLALVVGVVLSLVFPHIRFVDWDNTFFVNLLQAVGLGLLIWGTFLVFFSQKYRKQLYLPGTNKVCFDFYVGPYKYFRHTTYMGLLILFFGLAAVTNAVAIAVVTIITAGIVHTTLLKKEEALLQGECGDAYRDYLKKVPL